MSDAKYVTIAGIVQFPAQEREVQGKNVRDITVRAANMKGADGEPVKVRVTLWPDLDSAVVNEGDAVFCDGKLSVNTKTGDDGVTRTYVNLSATGIAVIPGVKAKKAEVANQSAPTPADDIPFAPSGFDNYI